MKKRFLFWNLIFKMVKSLKLKESFKIASELLNYIPEEPAKHYKIVPIDLKEGVLRVGAVNPDDLDSRDALNFITSRENIDYTIWKISEADFDNLFKQYNQAGLAVNQALEQIEEQSDVILGIDDDEEVAPHDLIKEEAPIIKLVSTILSQSVAQNASDVHIEPGGGSSIIRYRIDGVLDEGLRFPKKVHDPLIARVKILSNLRLDERRRPQDGRFSTLVKDRRVDFRVATLPTSEGEKIVLRVLDRKKGLRTLADLGLSDSDLEKIVAATKRPYGLFLSAGPTGAGKTTTIYSILSTLDKEKKNIVSLEEPVEFTMDGINQSNIRPEIGYTFASGLRSILRGDPDIIFVGEIRDKETAQLAVQSALTGHLVFSTIHTNTAIGAVSRLINFGIDPFLIAPTLSFVISQRMARRIDGEGREVIVREGLRKKLTEKFSDLPSEYRSKVPSFDKFQEAVPTDDNLTGMRGRVGVFETFNINDDIREIILSGGTENDLYKVARKDGMLTLSEDAIVKGLEGKIPFSEVMKVNSEESLSDILGEADVDGSIMET